MRHTTNNDDPVSELSVWAPRVLAILRIVSAVLLIDQGLTTLLHFPQAGVPDALDAGAAGIEVVGGALIAVGLYTRVAALAAAAETAMAYGAFDRPDTALLFCAIFFYLVFAGPGLWSLDGRIHRPDIRTPREGGGPVVEGCARRRVTTETVAKSEGTNPRSFAPAPMHA